MESKSPQCVQCQRSSDETPLVPLRFQGRNLWICTEHLPILIHKSEQIMHLLAAAGEANQSE